MPLVDAPIRPARAPRTGALVTIKPTRKAFNNFPAIMAAFPRELSEIVVETTNEYGRLAQAFAPTQQNPRRGDPPPGTLKRSMRTRFYRKRATGNVITGRVEFPAKDRRGHRYARPLETTSVRRTRRGLIRVVKSSRWFVPVGVAMRRVFYRRLAGLEARLPH